MMMCGSSAIGAIKHLFFFGCLCRQTGLDSVVVRLLTFHVGDMGSNPLHERYYLQ